MEFTVINGELEVGRLEVTYVSNASTVMVGDIQCILLANAFETPPEETIVGVTLPFIE